MLLSERKKSAAEKSIIPLLWVISHTPVGKYVTGEAFGLAHEDTAASDCPSGPGQGKGCSPAEAACSSWRRERQHLWVTCCHALAVAVVTLLILRMWPGFVFSGLWLLESCVLTQGNPHCQIPAQSIIWTAIKSVFFLVARQGPCKYEHRQSQSLHSQQHCCCRCPRPGTGQRWSQSCLD